MCWTWHPVCSLESWCVIQMCIKVNHSDVKYIMQNNAGNKRLASHWSTAAFHTHGGRSQHLVNRVAYSLTPRTNPLSLRSPKQVFLRGQTTITPREARTC